MKKISLLIVIAIISICLSGCELDSALSRSKKASDVADMESLQNEVKRLGTELTLLKEQMDRFTQEQEDSLAAVKSAATKLEQEAASLKIDVDAKIAASESRQNKTIKQLDAKIESVVKEVTAVLSRMKSSGNSGGTTSGGTEKGFYHTVADGENPWSIAQKYKAEYGVTAQDILEANGLKSGDAIRAGQKLFIPVKK